MARPERRARERASEEGLQDTLDQVANPEGCTWDFYDGPLFVEFAVNAEVEVVMKK